MASSETLRSVIEAGRTTRRLDELSTARVIGKAAEKLHAAQQKAGGKAIGPITPARLSIAESGEVRVGSEPEGAESGLGYSSPEQLAGNAGDRRSDVFSLGTLMWEALTHQRLFEAMNDAGIKLAVAEREITPPSELNANIPSELSVICMKALARNPADRYQSAKVMAAEIEAVLDDAGYGDTDEKIATYLAELHKAAQKAANTPRATLPSPTVQAAAPDPIASPAAPGIAKSPTVPPTNVEPPRPVRPSEPAPMSPAALLKPLAVPPSATTVGSVSASVTLPPPNATVTPAAKTTTPPPAAAATPAIKPAILPPPSTTAIPAGKSGTLPPPSTTAIPAGKSGTLPPPSATLTIASRPAAAAVTATPGSNLASALANAGTQPIPSLIAAAADGRTPDMRAEPPPPIAAPMAPVLPVGKGTIAATVPPLVNATSATTLGATTTPAAAVVGATTVADSPRDTIPDGATVVAEATPPASTTLPRVAAVAVAEASAVPDADAIPHPVGSVNLGPIPGSTGRESQELLAGWGWGTGSHPALAEYSDDDGDPGEPSRKPLFYVIGGGFALAAVVTIIALGFGGSSKKVKPPPAAATKEAVEPQVAIAPSSAPSGSADEPGTGSSAPAIHADTGSATATVSPDPTKPDPTKPDSIKPDPIKADPTKADPTKADPTKADPTKADPTRPDSIKADPTRPDPTKVAKADPTKVTKPDPARPDPTKVTKPDPARPDPAKVTKPDPARPDPAKVTKPDPNKIAKPDPTKTTKPDKTTRPDPTKIAKTDPVKAAKPKPDKAESKVDVETSYRIGIQQFARGDTSGALASLRTSLAGNPNYPPTWRGLGLVFEKLGEKDQARAAYKRYLQLAPSAPDADQIRGRLERLGA